MSDALKERQWITLEEAAGAIGLSTGKVRRLIEEHALIAKKVGGQLQIMQDTIKNGEPLAGLRGTIVLLIDSGFSEPEAIDWLLAHDETLEAAPLDALRQGRKTQVRHSVQLLGM